MILNIINCRRSKRGVLPELSAAFAAHGFGIWILDLNHVMAVRSRTPLQQSITLQENHMIHLRPQKTFQHTSLSTTLQEVPHIFLFSKCSKRTNLEGPDFWAVKQIIRDAGDWDKNCWPEKQSQPKICAQHITSPGSCQRRWIKQDLTSTKLFVIKCWYFNFTLESVISRLEWRQHAHTQINTTDKHI